MKTFTPVQQKEWVGACEEVYNRFVSVGSDHEKVEENLRELLGLFDIENPKFKWDKKKALNVEDTFRVKLWADGKINVQDISTRISENYDNVFVPELQKILDRIELITSEVSVNGVSTQDLSLISADYYRAVNIEPDLVSEQELRMLELCSLLAEDIWVFSVDDKNNVFILAKPVFLAKDDRFLLDNDQRMALEWEDGTGEYWLRGVKFEEKMWKKLVDRTFDIKDMLNEATTAEQRMIAWRMLKPELLLKNLNAELVDSGNKYSDLREKWGDDFCKEYYPFAFNEPTKLYKVEDFGTKVMGEEARQLTAYCIVMNHPSIEGQQYLEWVRPDIAEKGDADFCQAWACGLDLEEYMAAVEA